MRRIFKIILAIVAILVIIIVAFGAIFFLDLSAYTATGSQTLPASGSQMGTALVLYDPGLSGTSTKVATQIATDLQNQTLKVTLAGIKSSAAANTAGYDIIVIGGPIYAGSPTASVKDALNNLHVNSTTVVGVFGSGQGATTPEDVASIQSSVPALTNGQLPNNVVVKIGETEDLNARSSDFVNQMFNKAPD
jgi:flavodoxin